MAEVFQITLEFSGSNADRNEIDLYDVSKALVGFQRSLALTTHLILNGEIITQAPALRGASILALPADEGSWKLPAAIAVATGIFTLGTAPKDTPVGHLVASAYDYVISESLGFHVDYDKTLGQQYEEMKNKDQQVEKVPQPKFDSLIEKCEPAIKDMHRPISWSETAQEAKIVSNISGKRRPVGQTLDTLTYEYIRETRRSEFENDFKGRVSSYNSNTYKGRIYLPTVGRPIPFELLESSRNRRSVSLITASLAANARRDRGDEGYIIVSGYENTSRSGQLKRLEVTNVTK